MITLPKSGKLATVPDEGMMVMAFNLAQASFGALSNHSVTAATIQAAAAPGYSNGLQGAITRKSGGIYVVCAMLTISVNAGSLADADSVTYQLLRGATPVGPILGTAASTATGGAAGSTITASCFVLTVDNSGANVGVATTYSLKIVAVNAAHTSGVVATTDGSMVLIELPG